MVENWDGWYDKWYPKPRPFVVPDYRIYKVEGVQELEYVRDTLAKRGLKDPWLRNEVWKFPKWHNTNVGSQMAEFVFGKKGFAVKWGLVAAGVTIVMDNLYWKWKYGGKPEYGHDFRDWWHHFYHKKPNQ